MIDSIQLYINSVYDITNKKSDMIRQKNFYNDYVDFYKNLNNLITECKNVFFKEIITNGIRTRILKGYKYSYGLKKKENIIPLPSDIEESLLKTIPKTKKKGNEIQSIIDIKLLKDTYEFIDDGQHSIYKKDRKNWISLKDIMNETKITNKKIIKETLMNMKCNLFYIAKVFYFHFIKRKNEPIPSPDDPLDIYEFKLKI